MDALEKLREDLYTVCSEVYECTVLRDYLYLYLNNIYEDKLDDLNALITEYYGTTEWDWNIAEFYNGKFKGDNKLNITARHD